MISRSRGNRIFFALIVFLCLGFWGCGKNVTGGSSPSPNGSEPASAPPVIQTHTYAGAGTTA